MGGLVEFVSEDGRQRKVFDFSALPGHPRICEELATAFEQATGPLGSWKRRAAAQNLWTVARQSTQWLSDNQPRLTSLAQLSTATARLLAMSLVRPSGDRLAGVLRTLLGYSEVVPAEVVQALARQNLGGRHYESRQPYTHEELRRITVVARGIARRARTRLRTHWELVAGYRAGQFDHLRLRETRVGTWPRRWSIACAPVTFPGLRRLAGRPSSTIGRSLPLAAVACSLCCT